MSGLRRKGQVRRVLRSGPAGASLPNGHAAIKCSDWGDNVGDTVLMGPGTYTRVTRVTSIYTQHIERSFGGLHEARNLCWAQA